MFWLVDGYFVVSGVVCSRLVSRLGSCSSSWMGLSLRWLVSLRGPRSCMMVSEFSWNNFTTHSLLDLTKFNTFESRSTQIVHIHSSRTISSIVKLILTSSSFSWTSNQIKSKKTTKKKKKEGRIWRAYCKYIIWMGSIAHPSKHPPQQINQIRIKRYQPFDSRTVCIYKNNSQKIQKKKNRDGVRKPTYSNRLSTVSGKYRRYSTILLHENRKRLYTTQIMEPKKRKRESIQRTLHGLSCDLI